jgi:3',5'-cyclic AMP phosphodiesterase CpdA
LATLRPPGGRLLSRFATVSDVHIGERRFGVMGRIHDHRERSHGSAPYPVRALQAALDEAAAWGAELVVCKGDLTARTVPAEVRDAARILAGGPVPCETVLGNHDNVRGVNSRAILQAEGLPVSWVPRAVDLPGVRLVLVNTLHGDPRKHRGQLPPAMADQAVALAAEAPAGAWLGLHHPPERYRFPSVYPPGIPFGEGRYLLDSLARAKPGALVSCGHRHRNRRYDHGPVVVTEVGSTKDYPGVWAGYKVYEGGIVQFVRRIARPDVICWTEATRRAMNGQWGRWSPGRLDDRCLSVSWAPR